MLLLAATLHSWGWAVVGVYVALIVGAGIWAQRRAGKATATDYFLAGRHIPVWAVAVSTLATAQSAATFVGVPQDAYDGNLTYLSANIGGLLAAVVLAWVFIPAYYRLGVATPYQMLETRFGAGSKLATSWVYLIGRVFASGARIYVGAIPVALAFFGDREPQHLAIVIAGFMIFAALYTLWGGLESVIWTDVVQVAVYLGAAGVAVILLYRYIPADTNAILDALRQGGNDGGSKLTVFTSGVRSTPPFIDFGGTFTLVSAVTGWTLLNLAAFGTDQDFVQRLLTCKDSKRGGRSIIMSMLIGIPVVVLFAAIGLLLWVVYNRPALMGDHAATIRGDTAEIFLKFSLSNMPAWAGGLVIAGVLAAGPAGINASLNSMGGTIINDFYRPMVAPGRTEKHYVNAGRVAVVLCGVALGAFALACARWQPRSSENLLAFVLGVMGFAYAGLLGVFFTALFSRRGTVLSVILAMATGFLAVLAMQPWVWKIWAGLVPWIGDDLAKTTIAAPWRLLFGTVLATAVCALPRGRGRA
ncbi:Sodium/glucose cotransporter [Phycisphaerales bacterium]|nr:Sodium/glucose cotransporter [Phycisphaerales bacterium]